MADTPRDLNRLLDEIRGGSQEAARELVESYGDTLRRIARRRLPPQLRGLFDSTDLVQEAWADFFAKALYDHQFHQTEQLLAFLARVVANKAMQVGRKWLACQKRSAEHVASFGRQARSSSQSQPGPELEPLELLAVKEEFDRAADGCPPLARRLLDLLRDGYTQQEIAQRLGLHERTVRRLLAVVRAHVGAEPHS